MCSGVTHVCICNRSEPKNCKANAHGCCCISQGHDECLSHSHVCICKHHGPKNCKANAHGEFTLLHEQVSAAIRVLDIAHGGYTPDTMHHIMVNHIMADQF